jgi:delta 1-pyrroline-5-carboxylate dehydrogenase
MNARHRIVRDLRDAIPVDRPRSQHIQIEAEMKRTRSVVMLDKSRLDQCRKQAMGRRFAEIFGPVCSVIPFGDDDEAVRLANDSEYGLSAAIVSRSVQRALALGNRLNTGLLHINDQTINDEPWAPFGGRGASGNGGRIGGPANGEEFTQWQWLTIKDEAPLYPF